MGIPHSKHEHVEIRANFHVYSGVFFSFINEIEKIIRGRKKSEK